MVSMNTLDLLSDDDVEQLATRLLLDGFDSYNLRILASGEGSVTTEGARTTLARVFDEIGEPRVDSVEAARTYARWVAEGIVNGEVEPYRGAREIWKVAQKVGLERLTELHPFIYAAAEYEDRPEDRPFFQDAIKREASGLLDRQSPAVEGER